MACDIVVVSKQFSYYFNGNLLCKFILGDTSVKIFGDSVWAELNLFFFNVHKCFTTVVNTCCLMFRFLERAVFLSTCLPT